MTTKTKLPSWVNDACTQIEHELGWFQWAYPDRGNNRGEVSIDRETHPFPMWLRLDVYVADNDHPEDDTLKPLSVHVDIVPIWDADAQQQIRGVIHGFLTHEADEQMYFTKQGIRVFDPHSHER